MPQVSTSDLIVKWAGIIIPAILTFITAILTISVNRIGQRLSQELESAKLEISDLTIKVFTGLALYDKESKVREEVIKNLGKQDRHDALRELSKIADQAPTPQEIRLFLRWTYYGYYQLNTKGQFWSIGVDLFRF